MGSEPAVFAVIKSNQDLFWPTILVATVGNTLGGMVNYWLGTGVQKLFAKNSDIRSLRWMRRFGAKTLLLGWLPIIGDGLCTLAGWVKLPFWPCVAYMALGKFLRYVIITSLLLYVPDGFWHQLAHWLG